MPMPGKRNKYFATKVELDGHKFDSLAESNVYRELLWREKQGQIQALEVHPKPAYDLWVNGVLVCRYNADFRYKVGGRTVVIDVKSKMTAKLPAYRLKKKLMYAVHRIEIQEIVR